MDFKRRNEIGENRLPGRVVQNGVGRNSAVASEKMTVSYCTYSAEVLWLLIIMRRKP